MSVRSMVLIAVLAALLVIVFIWAAWLYTGHRAVRAEVQAARDAGYPMSVEELRRWHASLAESPQAGELYERAFDAMERIEQPDRWLRLPHVGQCESPPPGTPWPEEWFETAEAYLAERAEARRLIHQAASMGPAWFEIDWRSDGATTPRWNPLRQAARLIALEAEWHAESGRTEEAVESVLTLWGMAEALAGEPVVISQLSRWAFIGFAEWMTSQLLNIAPDLTPEQLQRVQEAMERIEIEAPLHRAMIGDMAWMHLQFQRGGEFGLGEQSARDRFDMHVRRALGVYSRDHALYLRHRMEDLEWFEARVRGESPPALQQRDVPWYAEIAEMYEDGMQMYPTALKRTHATRRLALTGVAVARYRVEHGDYPETLEALVPAYLDAVPEDPFTDGDPLGYRVAETGVIIYSVGFNGVDYGGRARNDEGMEDVGHSNTDITFSLGTAQTELWPEQWPSDWTPCEDIPPE